MPQEENAKAYTELINRLEDVKDAIKKQNYGIVMDILCKPYPEFQVTTHSELKESEDERIRKEIMSYIKSSGAVTNKQWIAWLEKQGEQKPIDKVESKFHKGEWLCENEPNNYARFIQILEIVNVQGKDRYRISRGIHNDEDIVEFNFVEKYYHKFDIQDAKDGDILFAKGSYFKEYIFIYSGMTEDNVMSTYCGFDMAHNNFDTKLSRFGRMEDFETVYPATKEQRDTLMKAMADAGYTFDFDKKKLKRIEQKKDVYNKLTDFETSLKHIMEEAIECGDTHNLKADADMLLRLVQKPAWSEGVQEEQVSEEFINAFGTMLNDGLPDIYLVSEERIKKSGELLFSIARKQLKNEKPAWSEEDEETINFIKTLCDDKDYDCHNNFAIKKETDRIRSWLESLKSQNTWKPSDEQIEALNTCLIKGEISYVGQGYILQSLYDKLKTL